jgi:hypothetical protein
LRSEGDTVDPKFFALSAREDSHVYKAFSASLLKDPHSRSVRRHFRDRAMARNMQRDLVQPLAGSLVAALGKRRRVGRHAANLRDRKI